MFYPMREGGIIVFVDIAAIDRKFFSALLAMDCMLSLPQGLFLSPLLCRHCVETTFDVFIVTALEEVFILLPMPRKFVFVGTVIIRTALRRFHSWSFPLVVIVVDELVLHN
jgi:hypothetical protein